MTRKEKEAARGKKEAQKAHWQYIRRTAFDKNTKWQWHHRQVICGHDQEDCPV